jgi:NADH-quinone oxidoreductase subunit C
MSDTNTTGILERVTRDLSDRFNAATPDRRRDNLMYITVPKAEAVGAITFLQQFHGFTHLAFFTAVDVIERSIFRLCYMLHNYEEKTDVCLQTEISRDAPVADSIHHLWAGAKVYERELKEMFGIDFPGCPRVDEPFALEGWREIPPMRRDFDTRAYSEKTYYPRPGREKHDRIEIMKKELYPEVDL